MSEERGTEAEDDKQYTVLELTHIEFQVDVSCRRADNERNGCSLRQSYGKTITM